MDATNLFLINGVPGSLGTPLVARLEKLGIPHVVVSARLEDPAAIRAELSAVHVDRGTKKVVVVPLAAITSLPDCEKDPDTCWKTNVTDTVAFVSLCLDWSREKQLAFACIGISSSHVYQEKPSPHLLSEEDEVAPRSQYGRSKLGTEEKLRDLGFQKGFSVAVLRIFGILAIEQPPHFLLPGLIRRVKAKEYKEVPGMDYSRDYLDARDVIRILVEFGSRFANGLVEDGIYNVCSSSPVRIGGILERLARIAGETGDLGMTAGKTRADDIPWMVGANEKLEVALGTREIVQIPLDETLREAYERAR